MTKEEILAMETGEELDILVSQKVMGQVGYGFRTDYNKYSTDISAAWQVVEKMSQLSYDMALLLRSSSFEPILKIWMAPDWYCDFRSRGEIHPPKYEWVDHQKTAPEAICKAALLAKVESKQRSKEEQQGAR